MLKNIYMYSASALLVLFSVFLPWVSVLGFSVNGSATNDGKITFGLAIVIGLMVFLITEHGKFARIMVALCSLAAIAIAIYNIVDVMSYKTSASDDSDIFSNIHPSTGIGLWVLLLGGLVGVVASVRVPERQLTAQHIQA